MSWHNFKTKEQAESFLKEQEDDYGSFVIVKIDWRDEGNYWFSTGSQRCPRG